MNITERELLERLQNNLLGRETEDYWELVNEIIIAFEDAEIDGVTEVIARGYNNSTFEAYLNHMDSPIYNIWYEENEGIYKVTEVSM